MSISFNEISATRTPFLFVEFDSSRAAQGVQQKPYRALVMGQRLAAGTVGSSVPTRVRNKDEASKFWGDGSQIAQMFATWFANNDSTEVWGCGLVNPSGVAAVGNILFGGSPTESGTAAIYIGGRRYAVSVASGATVLSIAQALQVLVAADTQAPVTAPVPSDGNFVPTARHLGTYGNDLDIRHSYADGEQLPAGLTVTITAMASGAGDTALANAFLALGDQWYDVMVHPTSDSTNLAALEADLASRASALRHIGAIAITAKTGSLSTLSTLGNARNANRSSIMGSNASPTSPWEFAAAVGAVVVKYAALDTARPFQTLPLAGVLAPAIRDRFTQADRNSLLFSGISTFTVANDGTVQLERVISTYKTNAAGGADPAWLDVNTALTLDFLRWDLINLLSTRYARHKIGKDGGNYGSGQAIVTPSDIKAELVARFALWEDLALVEGAEQFARDLIVERNSQDASRLDILLSPDLVNGLRVIAARMAFLL